MRIRNFLSLILVMMGIFLSMSGRSYALRCTADADNVRGHSLVLTLCHLKDENMPAVVAYINAHTDIDELILFQNRISSSGAAILARLASVKKLSLGGNAIDDKGAIALAKNSSFKILDLSDNNIGVSGAVALSQSVSIIYP